jgi:apolipoprotein N-acyltransferase
MKDLYPNPLVAKLAAVDSTEPSAVVLPESSVEDDAENSNGEVDRKGDLSGQTDQSSENANL